MLSDANKLLGVDFFLNNRFILALVYASSALPFTVYLLSGYFRTLPKGFEEAAYIDGCGYFKTMTKIMVPMANQVSSQWFYLTSCHSGMSISLPIHCWMEMIRWRWDWKSDGSGKDSYQLRYYVCRTCDCYAADIDLIHHGTETSDRGYDSRRTERLGGTGNE